MRGRIRTIKPEAHKDADLWDAEEQSGLPLFRAYTALWGQADREGRFVWKPRELKLECLPYWQGDFSHVLDVLATRGFIVKYECQGKAYGWIPTLKEHQHFNGKEPQSKLPPPTEEAINSASSERVNDTLGTCEARKRHVPIPSPIPSLPDPFPEGVQGESSEPERETPVPQDLPERCERAKIPEQFARTYGVPIETVRAHIVEIQTYWTIGGGSGRRKRNWLHVARTRLHELGKAGDLGRLPAGAQVANRDELRRRREAADRAHAEQRRREVEALSKTVPDDPQAFVERGLGGFGK